MSKKAVTSIILSAVTLFGLLLSFLMPSPIDNLLIYIVFLVSVAMVAFDGSGIGFLISAGAAAVYLIADYILSFILALLGPFGSLAGEGGGFLLPIGLFILTYLFIGKKALGKPGVLIIIGIAVMLAADIAVSLYSSIWVMKNAYSGNGIYGYLAVFISEHSIRLHGKHHSSCGIRFVCRY